MKKMAKNMKKLEKKNKTEEFKFWSESQTGKKWKNVQKRQYRCE